MAGKANPFKHTPGPWKVEPGINHIKVWGERPKTGPSLIAEVRNEGTAHSTSGAREQANAVLIAAAPAMYEALQAMLDGILFTRGASMSEDRWRTLTTIARQALAQAQGYGYARSNAHPRLVARHHETPVLAESEKLALNALDPALTPLCVSFVGMQETPSRDFGLYNIEENIDPNLPLHSTVSLQTIALYGYRPVMV